MSAVTKLQALVTKIRDRCANGNYVLDLNLWPLTGGVAIRYIPTSLILECVDELEAAAGKPITDEDLDNLIRLSASRERMEPKVKAMIQETKQRIAESDPSLRGVLERGDALMPTLPPEEQRISWLEAREWLVAAVECETEHKGTEDGDIQAGRNIYHRRGHIRATQVGLDHDVTLSVIEERDETNDAPPTQVQP